jgi:DNA-binding NarL/FixJ family response regulator
MRASMGAIPNLTPTSRSERRSPTLRGELAATTSGSRLRLVGGALHTEPWGWDAHDPQERRDSAPSESRGGMIRVLLAMGESLVTAGYRALLERGGGIEIVGEAATARQAVERATQTGCMVALLDQRLAGLEDLETTTSVVSRLSSAGIAVLLIAARVDQESVLSAVRAGAVVVLRTDEKPSQLIPAVRLAAQGQALLPAHAIRRLLDDLGPQPVYRERASEQLDELTAREREVVALVARGLTNGEIAARLVISPKTVKTHVSRAMTKLARHDRAQLVVAAYEHGLVTPRSEIAKPDRRESAENGPACGGRMPRAPRLPHGRPTAALYPPSPATRPASGIDQPHPRESQP